MTDPRPEEVVGPSSGPVLLDIGGRFGGLVLRVPRELDGTEIEIRRPSEPWTGRHVGVRARPMAGPDVFAAVFGPLEEGSYELRRRAAPHDFTRHRVRVVGGQVADTSWPARNATR